MADTDRQRFLQEGYLVVPEVVPRQQLEKVRSAYEALVNRQRWMWSRSRLPDDPPGGDWEKAPQPRLNLNGPLSAWMDSETAPAVDVWLGERVLGTSRTLMDVADAAATDMMLMCSPVRDHGPANWHRDHHPIDTAPLQAYIDDIRENGPLYIQWNIPLYDDDVLWVLPQSHLRENTEQENEMLLENSKRPLPGGVQTHLKAGDGVVYILPILHWASSYSTRMRRTIHGGFSIFTNYEQTGFFRTLSSQTRTTFEKWQRQSDEKQQTTEQALRAALKGDVKEYERQLVNLRPGIGEYGRRYLSVFLCKAAYFVYLAKHPEEANVPDRLLVASGRQHSITLNWGPQFSARFTRTEADRLWQRFQPLELALRTDKEQFLPGFQSGPMKHRFVEMPPTFGLPELYATWAT